MPERRLRQWISRGWYEGHRRVWLAPFAWLYGAFTALRRLAYRKGVFTTQHAAVPVIVVGNITVGGTGKTPLVIWLAGQLQSLGYRVGVVLRGYGGRVQGAVRVTAASRPADVGDEAVMIARRLHCPVAVAARRSEAVALLVADGVQVLVSDDGLQHLAMARDLEIAVVDGMRGLGNGCLLPQGPLRESADRLQQVSAVVVHGSAESAVARRVEAPLYLSLQVDSLCAVADDALRPLDGLAGTRVHAVAATGNPARFFAQLRQLGCQIVEHVHDDHHAYAPADLDFPDDLPIVMTEKDAVKCRDFASGRMQYLRVSACLSDTDTARLMQMVQGCLLNRERKHA